MGFIFSTFKWLRQNSYATSTTILAAIVGLLFQHQQQLSQKQAEEKAAAKIAAQVAIERSNFERQRQEEFAKNAKELEQEQERMIAAECNPSVQEAIEETKIYTAKRLSLSEQARADLEVNQFESGKTCEGRVMMKQVLGQKHKKFEIAKEGKCYKVTYAEALRLNRESKEAYFALQNAVYAVRECDSPDNPFDDVARSSEIPALDKSAGQGVR